MLKAAPLQCTPCFTEMVLITTLLGKTKLDIFQKYSEKTCCGAFYSGFCLGKQKQMYVCTYFLEAALPPLDLDKVASASSPALCPYFRESWILVPGAQPTYEEKLVASVNELFVGFSKPCFTGMTKGPRK